MNKRPARSPIAFTILTALFLASGSIAADPATAPSTEAAKPAVPVDTATGTSRAPGVGGADNSATPTLKILHLRVASSGEPASGKIALNGKLAVVLTQAPPRAADQYVLFFNGNEIKGLAPGTLTKLDNGEQALVFKLERNDQNDSLWKELLGAPKHLTVSVAVSLGQKSPDCKPDPQCKSTPIMLAAADGADTAFDFELISGGWFAAAAAAVGLTLFLVWGHARTRATLRDNLLPQLPANLQPYSLGRWQMSFWFVLIFSSFLFLYILLWDYNTVSTQALALMGISSATALASVEVDVYKDSPADKVNRGLQALGLNSYDDVLRVKQEIDERQVELAKNPSLARLAQLQSEIQDRNNILSVYEDKVKGFKTQGWFRDMTTDLNGTALHRLQVVLWTFALGVVFVVGVYRNLAMPPDFSRTLLALMGISSAGYVGFKFPEKNN